MTQPLLPAILLGALLLPACSSDLSTPPENVIEKQEAAVRNRPMPTDTELPPGLGADLPEPPSTQPLNIKK